jgi:hypothetical protein
MADVFKLTPAVLINSILSSPMHFPTCDDVSGYYEIAPDNPAQAYWLIERYSQSKRLVTHNDTLLAAIIVLGSG